MLIKTHLTPAKIVALYALVGGFWIICSDQLLSLLFANPASATLNRFQTIKGWFYVLATAVLLYWLIQRYAAALYRFQKELQLEESRLRGILETNQDGIVVFDRAGKVTLSNQAAREILGLEVGNDYRDCLKHVKAVNNNPFPETEHPFVQAMQTGNPLAGVECICSHPDGDLLLSVNAAPLYDIAGNIDGVVTSITDITAHKLAEAAGRDRDVAQAKIRAKTEFLAHITHELRTPLNGILGMSQMLQRQIFGALNPKQQDYLKRIYGSGEHLLELIDDILDLSKVEAGKEQLKLAPISVTDVCQSCLKLVQERAFDKGLQLTSDIEPEAKICIADKRRLKQMLINLLSNAVKFTPSGSISLIVRQLPDGIYFTVADTGIGIPPEDMHLLFQPFQQLDNQLKLDVKGTGLGLALTRNLARLHGGDVTAKSTLGKGSQFTIFLPQVPTGYVPSSLQKLRVNPTKQEPPHQGRILIVDGDKDGVMVWQDYLQYLGFQVQHIPDGKDFVAHVNAFAPDLILLEMTFARGFSGLDLLAGLRQQPQWQTLPVAIITATTVPISLAEDAQLEFSDTPFEDIQSRCITAGADECLSKPLPLEELDALLVRLLL